MASPKFGGDGRDICPLPLQRTFSMLEGGDG